MNAIRLLPVVSAVSVALSGFASARLMANWTHQQLLEKSDLVVVALPVASADTKEETNLPEITAARVTGVETKFSVSSVLKGDNALKDFVLRHYRLTNTGGPVFNGPTLAAFDPARGRSYLLYLVREAEGRYAPATGQTDPGFQAVHALDGVVHGVAAPPPPEAGPENAGLRMRLTAAPRTEPGKDGYDVRVELINVSDRPVTLQAGWWDEGETADVRDYIESSIGIETSPAIQPWIGQVRAPNRKSPQPERVLKAGQILSLNWQTDKRRLKNRVTDPNSVQNPEFPTPGLYSVHAKVSIITPGGTVLLRSNEQLVSAGGSRELPKHTFGEVRWVDAEKKMAGLNLGFLHKVQAGDQFRIRTAMIDHYRLTLTTVDPESSTGTLQPEPKPAEFPNREVKLPERGMTATLASP